MGALNLDFGKFLNGVRSVDFRVIYRSDEKPWASKVLTESEIDLKRLHMGPAAAPFEDTNLGNLPTYKTTNFGSRVREIQEVIKKPDSLPYDKVSEFLNYINSVIRFINNNSQFDSKSFPATPKEAIDLVEQAGLAPISRCNSKIQPSVKAYARDGVPMISTEFDDPWGDAFARIDLKLNAAGDDLDSITLKATECHGTHGGPNPLTSFITLRKDSTDPSRLIFETRSFNSGRPNWGFEQPEAEAASV